MLLRELGYGVEALIPLAGKKASYSWKNVFPLNNLYDKRKFQRGYGPLQLIELYRRGGTVLPFSAGLWVQSLGSLCIAHLSTTQTHTSVATTKEWLLSLWRSGAAGTETTSSRPSHKPMLVTRRRTLAGLTVKTQVSHPFPQIEPEAKLAVGSDNPTDQSKSAAEQPVSIS